MKKGTIRPRARCRWIQTQNGFTAYRLPVWLVSGILATYIVPLEPVPVPISIAGDDLHWGQWSYCPGTGAIRWSGTWLSGLFGGRWAIDCKADFNLLARFRLSMRFNIGGGFFDDVVGFWTPTTRSDECNQTTGYVDSRCDCHNFPLGGWFFAESDGSFAVNYHDLKDEGIDRNDTSPVTWTAPDDPW